MGNKIMEFISPRVDGAVEPTEVAPPDFVGIVGQPLKPSDGPVEFKDDDRICIGWKVKPDNDEDE